jgi:arginine:pyruvate transaminase
MDSGDTWQVHEKSLAMKQSGENIILLSRGDPDFRTPEPIVDNGFSHMRVGRTHYSLALGELNLRCAVADYESRISPLICSENEVSIYHGVTSAIYTVMSCLLNIGEEILIVNPLYVGYKPILQALDLKV